MTAKIGFALTAVAMLAACVDRLPAQDGRIVNATAVAKMPVDDLVKEYQADATGADRRYFTKAVEVSGKVATIERATDTTLVFTDTTGAEILHAVLLDDRSKEVVTGLDTDRRIRLKCYADKFATRVMLRSCIKA